MERKARCERIASASEVFGESLGGSLSGVYPMNIAQRLFF